MIRVSDYAERLIKEQANGRTISATVEALLAGGGDSSQLASIIEKLDYLEQYVDRRFTKIESMLDDTLVDRINAHKTRDPLNERVYVEWGVARELLYDFLDEKATEWRPGVYSALQSSDAELNCYIQDGYLCTDDHYGKQHLMVQVSPRVDQFLANKIEENINVA